MHVYAQFSFLWKSTKFKKIQVQFLEHREVIRPCTKNISCSTFLGFHLSSKNLEKRLRLLVTSFWKKKLKIIFFSPPGGARELKLRPFDSESKTTSDCSNSLFSKKITLNSYFSFYHYYCYQGSVRAVLIKIVPGKF